MKQFSRLEKYCFDNHINFDENIEKKFSMFFELLVEKNKVMNLTAITEIKDVEIRHFLDSVMAVPVIHALLSEKEVINIVDVGTGAGFPGIPLALLLPVYHFTLMDSLNKRIHFLEEVVVTLDLQNVKAVHARAEEFGQSEFRESFDLCVSRAVANMSVLYEYMIPCIKVGGYCVLYKSGDFQEELEEADYALKTLGGNLVDVRSFQLPDTDIKRSLIIIQKISNTPERYPRKAGKPSKTPLKTKRWMR